MFNLRSSQNTQPYYYDLKNKSHLETVLPLIPEILIISSIPPRECGIATYSQDLIKALNSKFTLNASIKICALEKNGEEHHYFEKVDYKLNISHQNCFNKLGTELIANQNLSCVVIQHEFGFFESCKSEFVNFLHNLNLPVIMVFHTVLPRPDPAFMNHVQAICNASKSIIVMTNSSKSILAKDYQISPPKINVIQHGTHLVSNYNKSELKRNSGFVGRKILSTFGLMSSGKSIETSLKALPLIIKEHPEVLFLILGKTHPTVKTQEGEIYREKLISLVQELDLENHVRFVNRYLPLEELLEFLQLTDIYLFTSKDPNQAVSGTFSYALGCGCPIVSTPIPHALELLNTDTGLIFDFENSVQLAQCVNSSLKNKKTRHEIRIRGLSKMASTAWENSAIAHAQVFQNSANKMLLFNYKLPEINLNHLKKLTTEFGMIQFSRINHPDLGSGYTLDDNARALIAMCMHFD